MQPAAKPSDVIYNVTLIMCVIFMHNGHVHIHIQLYIYTKFYDKIPPQTGRVYYGIHNVEEAKVR